MKVREGETVRVRDGSALDGTEGVARIVGETRAVVEFPDGTRAEFTLDNLRRVIGLKEIAEELPGELRELDDACARMVDRLRAVQERLGTNSRAKDALGTLAELGAILAHLPPPVVPLARKVVDTLADELEEWAAQ